MTANGRAERLGKWQGLSPGASQILSVPIKAVTAGAQEINVTINDRRGYSLCAYPGYGLRLAKRARNDKSVLIDADVSFK